MFCSNCGKEIVNNSNFCSNCGTKILNNANNNTKENLEKNLSQERDGGNVSDKSKTAGMIYAGFAFGLCSTFFSFFIQVLGIACGVIGIVLNHISKAEVNYNNKKYNISGYIFSIIGLAVAVLIIVITAVNENYQQNQAAEALNDLLDIIF